MSICRTQCDFMKVVGTETILNLVPKPYAVFYL